jgi:hypothetical protein
MMGNSRKVRLELEDLSVFRLAPAATPGFSAEPGMAAGAKRGY